MVFSWNYFMGGFRKITLHLMNSKIFYHTMHSGLENDIQMVCLTPYTLYIIFENKRFFMGNVLKMRKRIYSV